MILDQYFQVLRNEVRRDAGTEQDEAFLAEAFTRRFLDLLAEAGEVADAEVCYFLRSGVRIDGYVADENEDTLDLFVAVHHDSDAPVRLEKAKVDTAFRQLTAFFTKASAGLHQRMEEVEPAFMPAQIIYRQSRNEDGFSRIRLILITDGIVNSARLPEPPELGGAEVTLHVWDIERLFRWYSSGRDREQVVIDLAGEDLPPVRCLVFDQPRADYVSYLAIFPAAVLVWIYGKYGPRLLERNVRSFLQVRGDINKGIRGTILGDPHRFLAYNNGLTATASEITTTADTDGSVRLARLVDLQIVNGGQTTASLFRAVRKDKADVSAIAVQVKLNQVRDPDALDELVGHISKYANSQNKVSVSDLSANDPFNQRLEELSRTVWAPATSGAQIETKWFYERARAQYADELGRANTPSQKSRFEREYPRSQLFGKTEMAKYELSWDQRPHIVSRGAQKCFVAFHEIVEKRGNGFRPDETYFRHLIARKILFDGVDRIVRRRAYGAYKAQIAAYTVALVSRLCARRFDFEGIWRQQGLSPAVEAFLARVSDAVQPVIAQPPGGKDVTIWYKSDACWTACVGLAIALPADLGAAIERVGAAAPSGIDSPTAEEDSEIAWARSLSAEVWFGIANWAKETDSLAPWQRGIAFSLGKLALQGRAPSRKQAGQGRILHDEAIRLGFALGE